MPELPEVETIRRGLLKSVRGLVFRSVEVIDPRVVHGAGSGRFRDNLVGCRIMDVRRRGKAVIIDLPRSCLIVQPMMTGQMIAVPPSGALPVARETKVIFGLSGQWRMLYNDQRLFGRLQILDRAEDLPYIRQLGPEPLEPDFTPDVLASRLQGRLAPVKTVLMDGRCVAGIGNIYAAEILFKAGISPRRAAGRLKPQEVSRLHQAIREILNAAIEMGGTTVRNYRGSEGQSGRFQEIVQVYGRDGLDCRACGGPVRRIVQAQRSTFYCPACQH